MVQPALHDEPRRSRGELGPSLAENQPKTKKTIIYFILPNGPLSLWLSYLLNHASGPLRSIPPGPGLGPRSAMVCARGLAAAVVGLGRDTARPHFVLTYSTLRNNASGPLIGLSGRILAGLLPGKHRNLPFGRPEGRFLCLPCSSPFKIRPGRPSYGPEAPLRNIE